MAALSKPSLQVKIDRSTDTARVVVAGTVEFNELELNLMRSGLAFSLRAFLIGHDASVFTSEVRPGRPPRVDFQDDVRFRFDPKRYPDRNPTRVEKYTFEATLGLGVLNEDRGLDELVASVVLTNNLGSVPQQRRSNLVIDDFTPAPPS